MSISNLYVEQPFDSKLFVSILQGLTHICMSKGNLNIEPSSEHQKHEGQNHICMSKVNLNAFRGQTLVMTIHVSSRDWLTCIHMFLVLMIHVCLERDAQSKQLRPTQTCLPFQGRVSGTGGGISHAKELLAQAVQFFNNSCIATVFFFPNFFYHRN